MNEWVRIYPGIPRECRNIHRTHNDLGSPIPELMTPKQRYKLQKSEQKWEESEDGQKAREILKSGIMNGEVGRFENFRFIFSE
uniref:Uncharacterized protein n=1 Tax=viral metagenome TaxID=1070528 RepID=A0A6M3XIW5_9ZZZZ